MSRRIWNKLFMLNEAFKIEISATVVSWYGAIVATASVFVIYSGYLRDRVRIKIDYKKNMKIVGQQSVYDHKKTYFNITVINKGRRRINITKAGLMVLRKNKPFIIFSDSFASHRRRILTEENPSSDFLAEQDDEELKHVWYIWAQDATGRIYKKYLYFFPTCWRILHWLKYKK